MVEWSNVLSAARSQWNVRKAMLTKIRLRKGVAP